MQACLRSIADTRYLVLTKYVDIVAQQCGYVLLALKSFIRINASIALVSSPALSLKPEAALGFGGAIAGQEQSSVPETYHML
jgi:hypothetical protein